MYQVLKFDLARNALRYLIRMYGIKELYIPYYLCDVVRHTLREENCKPIFYHIDDNFFPVLNPPLAQRERVEFRHEKVSEIRVSGQAKADNSYILYPNYFGICQNNVRELVKIYPKLILDNAHAYFDEPMGFACFNAGHKFGRKNSYLWVQSKEQAQILSVGQDLGIRKQKFLELHSKYRQINTLNIDILDITSPFVYPCLTKTIEEADELVKQLKKEGKTIYRYWNNLPENFNEYKFYSRLVPIPLD